MRPYCFSGCSDFGARHVTDVRYIYIKGQMDRQADIETGSHNKGVSFYS